MPQGVTLTGDGWQDITKDKNWIHPNFKWTDTEEVRRKLNGAILRIHFKHNTQTVDGSKPNEYPSDLSDEDKAKLTKEVVRTINEYLPTGTVTKTQTATLTRTATFDKVTKQLKEGSEGKWQKDSWADFAVDQADGYTPVITREGETTPLKSIDQQTVDENTQPVVINVHYTATATAKLTGNGSATYTGNPITIDDLNNSSTGLKITVTGPTANAGTLALNAGDVEFSTDGTTWTTALPTNAATYQVRLTTQGENAIKSKYDIVWTDKNGNSTITSDAKFTINPLSANSVLNNLTEGNYTKVYDGSATASVDPTKLGATVQLNGQPVNLDMTGLTSADFQWVDADGNALSEVPKNVGTYHIKLTSDGLTVLQNHNKNFKLTNSGLGTYTITQAQASATLSGSGTRDYNGSGVTLADLNRQDANNNITLTLHYPKNGDANYSETVQLTADDFVWNTPDGQAPVNANSEAYTLLLKSDVIKQLLKNAAGKGQGNVANVTVADDAINGSAQFTINKAFGSVTFSGKPSYTYTGSANPDYLKGFSIKIHEPNNPTYNLVEGDLEFKVNGSWTTTDPINHGTYQVRLSQAGWDHIKAINSDNITWSATASEGTGTYTITAANAATKLSGQNSMVYNGKTVTTDDLYTTGSTIKVVISGKNIANLPTVYTLTDGDYTWNTPDHSVPKNQGHYTITLTTAGLDKIQATIDAAVGAGNVKLSRDKTGSATFDITQAVASNLQLHGNEQSIYNGQAVQIDPTTNEFKDNYGFNNAEDLTIPELSADDFEWVDENGNAIADPKDAGTYYLQLSQKGRDAIASANTNYSFVNSDGKSLITGKITYTINPATLVIGVSGTASKVYDGQTASVTQDQINNGDIKLAWGDGNTSLTNEPTDLGKFTLTPEDLEVVDADGRPVSHANAAANDKTGNPVYYVRLKNGVLDKLKGLAGAKNYNISLSDSVGNYLIYQHKAQVTLRGNQTTIYGTDLALDPTKYSVSLTNWQGSNEPDLADILKEIGGMQAGDVYINGFTDGQMPKNVGTYQVKISSQLLDRLKQHFKDYDWDTVGENNSLARSGGSVEAEHDPATYVIKQAEATVTINGAQHIKYGERANIQYGGDNGYTISITAPANGKTQTIYADAKFDANDLKFEKTPGNVGSYTVKLSQDGLDKLAALPSSSNYDWTQAKNATASFYVDQLPLTITVNDNGSEHTVTYGSPDWLSVIKNAPMGYGIKITTTGVSDLSDEVKDMLANVYLSPNDFAYKTKPGNVGDYEVVLTEQGLQDLKAQLGTNFEYPQDANAISSTAKLSVTPGEAQANVNGSWSKNFGDPQEWPTAEQLSNAESNPNYYNLGQLTIYTANGKKVKIDLQPSDLAIAGFADDQMPTKVGTYYVVLSESGKRRIEALDGYNGKNYNWTNDPTGLYIINPSSAKANLAGSNQKTYDGLPVTTAEVNQDGKIAVNVTVPVIKMQDGSGSEPTVVKTINLGSYTLQDDDYSWDGGSAPTAAGTYTINLNKDKILAHLQDWIKQKADSGQNDESNVIISLDGLSGTAQFVVNKKDLTVTLSGNDGKTYDGDATAFYPSNSSLTSAGLVNNDSLHSDKLSASDYDWYDVSGNKLGTPPTDTGTYYIELNAAGLEKLKENNPNYNITESGKFQYVISPATADVIISGTGKDTKAEITNTNNNFSTSGTKGITIPTDLHYQFTNGTPIESGVYDVTLTPESLQSLKDANKNYNLTIKSNAKFQLDAVLTITFEDTAEGNKQVGEAISHQGVAESVIDKLGKDGHDLVIPENYELAEGEKLPKTYKFDTSLKQNLYIKLVHKTTTVDPTKPESNPKPDDKNWFIENNLAKEITRTIEYRGLSSDQLAQIPDSEKQQTVHFTRTALYDKVTGKLVPSSEGTWTAVNGENIWAGFTPHEFTNYTADKTVPEVTVTGDGKDSTIIITYTRIPDTTDDPGHNTDPGDHNKPGDNDHPANPDDRPGDHDHNKPGNKDHDHSNKPTKPGDHGQKPGKPNKKPAKPDTPANNNYADSQNGQGSSGIGAAQRERAASLAKSARTRGQLQRGAQLPQTGAASTPVLGMVLLVMANILALLGIRPKKKQ